MSDEDRMAWDGLRSAPPAIDADARQKAEAWITELGASVGQVELILATLGGLFEEGLAKSVIGRMGLNMEAVREELPILREVLRDVPDIGDEPTPNTEIWS
jgi:hypothetical protein